MKTKNLGGWSTEVTTHQEEVTAEKTVQRNAEASRFYVVCSTRLIETQIP